MEVRWSEGECPEGSCTREVWSLVGGAVWEGHEALLEVHPWLALSL